MFRSPLLPIFLTVFVDVLGLTLMLPLLPLYAEHFGATPFVATLLGASYAACQLISGPLLGRLSDRVGRKPVLLASQMGTFASLVLIACAGWISVRYGLALLFIGRMIDGSTAGNLSIAQAYISDVTRPENRTRAFGLIGIAFGTGFLVGPGISGLLASRYGFAAPVFLAASLSLLSIVCTVAFLPSKEALDRLKLEHGAPMDAGPPTGERTLALGRFLSRPLARRRLLQFFCFTTSFATLTGGLALFLERRFGFGVGGAGSVFMVSGFVGAAIQGGLIGRLVKRIGEARLALWGFVTMVLGYPLLGLIGTSKPALYVVVAFSSFGVAVVRPCLTTLITKSVGRHEQGAALGTSQSLASISQMVGQPLAGLIIGYPLLDWYGPAAGFFALFGAVLSLQTEPAADAVGSTTT